MAVSCRLSSVILSNNPSGSSHARFFSVRLILVIICRRAFAEVELGLNKLLNLNLLGLNSNHLTDGGISSWIGNQTSLKTIELASNHIKQSNVLKGSIPPLNNLTSGRVLFLSDNNLSGHFPFALLANLSELQHIDLSNNPMLELGMVDLSQINLNGTIPPWMVYNRTIDGLSVRGNSLGGTFPQPSSIKSTSSIVWLDMSENQFYGNLPVNIGLLLPQLWYLNLSRNNFEGTIPWLIGNISALEVLDLFNNGFLRELPNEFLENTTSLQYLSLSRNRLHGNILPEKYNIHSLKHLLLHNNRFTGEISPGLYNSTSLIVLDIRNNFITGTIPSWFLTLSSLASLLLAQNNFYCYIPLRVLPNAKLAHARSFHE
ncbi:hypothetical protein GIB67_016624 [Kingdonia uniflora]|uniref:Uncharacterized protein n=1 Tax=Kingdonia uniflora TaxID=39325 RepID=A0A7J7MZS5_9MAGN|nr:hypothetical protein GIB67_016624 [Kingdonia uniflora]